MNDHALAASRRLHVRNSRTRRCACVAVVVGLSAAAMSPAAADPPVPAEPGQAAGSEVAPPASDGAVMPSAAERAAALGTPLPAPTAIVNNKPGDPGTLSMPWAASSVDVAVPTDGISVAASGAPVQVIAAKGAFATPTNGTVRLTV